MSEPDADSAGPRSRGDRQRHAIISAVRDLMTETPFADLSVSDISTRAGVARSGFYFYFESKYAVLAQLLDDVLTELEERTEHFAPRGQQESPAAFSRRMVRSAAAVYARHDPVVSACHTARHSDGGIGDLLDRQMDVVIGQLVAVVDAEIRAGTACPVSDDIEALVRTLTVTTASMLAGDPGYLEPDRDLDRGVRVLERLWVSALWGGERTP